MKQVIKVVDVIHPNTKQLSNLFDCTLIRSKFVRDFAEGVYTPKTIKGYLTSIRHFCSYVLQEKPVGLLFQESELTELRDRLQRWAKAYKRECGKQKWKKAKTNIERLVTPDKLVD